MNQKSIEHIALYSLVLVGTLVVGVLARQFVLSKGVDDFSSSVAFFATVIVYRNRQKIHFQPNNHQKRRQMAAQVAQKLKNKNRLGTQRKRIHNLFFVYQGETYYKWGTFSVPSDFPLLFLFYAYTFKRSQTI